MRRLGRCDNYPRQGSCRLFDQITYSVRLTFRPVFVPDRYFANAYVCLMLECRGIMSGASCRGHVTDDRSVLADGFVCIVSTSARQVVIVTIPRRQVCMYPPQISSFNCSRRGERDFASFPWLPTSYKFLRRAFASRQRPIFPFSGVYDSAQIEFRTCPNCPPTAPLSSFRSRQCHGSLDRCLCRWHRAC